MKRVLLIFAVSLISIIGFSNDAKAQILEYNTMIGFRAGTCVGGSIKQFVAPQGAVELMVYNRWDGWVTALLYEHHMDIREFRGMEWYVGGGAHYGVWKEGKGLPPWTDRSNQDWTAYGVDLIVGIDYNINNSNFYIAFDWKPAYNFQDFTGLWEDEAAFTLRYAF